MHKAKAFFGSIINLGHSETYAFWASIILKLADHFAPEYVAKADALTQSLFNTNVETAIGALLGYAILRMTSKAAKAQPSQAEIDKAIAKKG